MELNNATARQIEAEELMKTEETANYELGDDEPLEDLSMMTDAEFAYLNAMEEVKIVSKKLVLAENAFKLVKDRIEALVERYEMLLVRINDEEDGSLSEYNESDYTDTTDGPAGGSDFEGSSVTTDGYGSSIDGRGSLRGREALAQRARRAELRAEVATREALLARQEADKVRVEKQKELDELHKKLEEMETRTQAMSASSGGDGGGNSHRGGLEYSHRSAQNEATSPRGMGSAVSYGMGYSEAQSYLRGARSGGAGGKEKERIKARFRSRHADRVGRGGPGSLNGERRYHNGNGVESRDGGHLSLGGGKGGDPRDSVIDRRLAGEEMYQHLDFYERSLRAVENNPVD